MGHDIERLINRSSIDGPDGVPLDVRRAAFAAVVDHPNFALALGHPVCFATIMVERKSFFNKSRWPDATKAAISESLNDVDSVVLLAFMTSDIVRTEHFTGGGITYEFVLHPSSFAILHAGFGRWYT